MRVAGIFKVEYAWEVESPFGMKKGQFGYADALCRDPSKSTARTIVWLAETADDDEVVAPAEGVISNYAAMVGMKVAGLLLAVDRVGFITTKNVRADLRSLPWGDFSRERRGAASYSYIKADFMLTIPKVHESSVGRRCFCCR